jgi:hypothetical protein
MRRRTRRRSPPDRHRVKGQGDRARSAPRRARSSRARAGCRRR